MGKVLDPREMVAHGKIKRSPWGYVKMQRELAPGVVQVETKSHGGLHLSPERLAAMPEKERTKDSWYEQDCEAAFVFWRFRDELVTAPDRLDMVGRWKSLFPSFNRIRMDRHR